MEWLIGGGATISFFGLCGIVWSILSVWRAKRANLDDEALRAAVQKMVPINMASLFASVLGLMAVAVGIFLG